MSVYSYVNLHTLYVCGVRWSKCTLIHEIDPIYVHLLDDVIFVQLSISENTLQALQTECRVISTLAIPIPICRFPMSGRTTMTLCW